MSKKPFWMLLLLGAALIGIGVLVDMVAPQTIFGAILMAAGAVVFLVMLLSARSGRRRRVADIQAEAAQQGNVVPFYHDVNGPGPGT